MNKPATVCALAILGLSAPAFASSELSSIDADATYAQPDALEEISAGEHAQHRSGKRPASRSQASKSSSNGRPSAAPTSRTPPARPSAAPASRTPSARPSGPSQREVAETHKVTTQGHPASTARTARPSTGPSRPAAVSSARPNPNARTTVTTVRPSSGRPSTAVRPTSVRPTAVRPGPTVVHTRPGVAHTRPGTVVHRPGVVHHRPTVVHHRPVVHTVRYTHIYPYHGIFVYGPRPVTHVHYVRSGPGPVRVEKEHLPKREVDREESLAIGLKGGSMISGTNDGQLYGDPGLGLVGRYRPAESIGLELAVAHHSSPFAAARSNTQIAPSVELFAFPWTRVSPYALAGATWNAASFADEVWNGNGYNAVRNVDSQWGLHAGLGLELALAKNFAIDLEGRYIGWIDERERGEAPGAIQATAGLLVHFK